MEQKVQGFMARVIAKNPGEVEFHQAVHEVVDSRGEFRHFFQINFFDHSYFYYRDLLKEHGYI